MLLFLIAHHIAEAAAFLVVQMLVRCVAAAIVTYF